MGRAQAHFSGARPAEDSLGDRDRGSQHPRALTASLSRARDASTQLPPSASQPPRRGRRPTANCESTGRLARARGGASGRPGLWETSASGAAAIATLHSSGPRNWTRQQKLTPDPSVPESRLPSLCRPPSEPDMLEHLSSLPTQMVRPLPAWALWSLHAAREPGSSATLVRDLPRAARVLPRMATLFCRVVPTWCASLSPATRVPLPGLREYASVPPGNPEWHSLLRFLGEPHMLGMPWCQSCETRAVTYLFGGGTNSCFALLHL